MKYVWHTREKRDNLILFCNGWGMDSYPFTPLASEQHDICILYDYRDMDFPQAVADSMSSYKRRSLVCWSMGVWVGQQLFSQDKAQFDKRIAINGTLLPIDDKYGIPVSLYDSTLTNYSDNGQERFYRRMCRESGVLREFVLVKPKREVKDQREELEYLKKMVERSTSQESIYTDVVISGNDLVMPTLHQEAFWQGHQSLVPIEGCHFPFFRWHNWDELFSLVNRNG
jgi:biotin synthesis protein BioG